MPIHQFVNFKQILVKRRSIFHKPCVSFQKTVDVFRHLLLKTAPYKIRPTFSYFQVQKNGLSTCLIFFILVLKSSYGIPLQNAARKFLDWKFLKAGKLLGNFGSFFSYSGFFTARIWASALRFQRLNTGVVFCFLWAISWRFQAICTLRQCSFSKHFWRKIRKFLKFQFVSSHKRFSKGR